MKQQTIKPGTTLSALIIMLGLNFLPIMKNAHAISVEEVCDRPTFKLWKTQQANRLWSPGEETLSAERSGKLFTYNCFTSDEIDQFFTSHGDRIENAHFYPILEMKRQGVADEDDDC